MHLFLFKMSVLDSTHDFKHVTILYICNRHMLDPDMHVLVGKYRWSTYSLSLRSGTALSSNFHPQQWLYFGCRNFAGSGKRGKCQEELRKFLVSVRPRDAESFIKRFPAFSWLFIRPPVGLNSRTVIETGMKLIQIKRDVYFVSKVSSAPRGK